MEHLVPLLRRAGKKRIALVGGVRQENVRAIGFYEKFGFRKEGEFATKVSNFDMIAEL
jgi:ribosomal protein S18 acetylase RimI-like enzyme